MRIFSTLSFVLMSIMFSNAQITYTNASFLQAGDVLEISTAFDTLMVVSAPSATATAWDFSTLTSTSFVADTIEPASSGSSYALFPTSDVLGNLIGGFGTAYTDVTTTTMTHVGGGFEFGPVSLIAPFSDPYIVQNAPITYPASNSDNFALQLSEHIDSIPMLRQLIDSMGLPVSPDSIRFSFTGSATQNVDAFGTCQMPDSLYNVIRQKSTIHTDIKIEVYTVIFGTFGTWADVTTLILGGLPVPISPQDTTVYYDYLADGRKQPIVRQRMNNTETQVTSIEFKGQNSPTAVLDIASETALGWKTYPNPAQEQLNITFENDQVLDQQLEVVDLLGRNWYNQTIRDQQFQINVKSWPQGQYVGVVKDKNSQIIMTKRIQVTR
ncbi:MAG: T9SS type A sorting domain-containing protein [Aureispira sp.]|nr:T9SS type A sorting domain-containing protein [Aureispira sp.]